MSESNPRKRGLLNKLTNFASEKIDKLESQKQLNEEFEKEAKKYIVNPLNMKVDFYKHTTNVFAIKNSTGKFLIIRKADKIFANQIVIGPQNQALKIVDIDDIIFNYPDNNHPYPLECFKCYYESYTIPIFHNIYNNNQTLINNGNVYGDINQTINNDLQQLEIIEQAIKSAKTSRFGKITEKKKNEAIILYGDFKNCIINKQPNKTLFEKFLKVIEIVAPTVVSIVTAIISHI